MLNLLLRKDRYELKKKYAFRFFSVVMFLASGVLIIFGVSLYASYLQVSIERDIVEGQLEKVQNSNITKDRNEFLDISKTVEEKIRYIDSEIFSPSVFITNIVQAQPEKIGVNSIEINFNKDEEDVVRATIILRGISQTRGDLVAFQKSLEVLDIFERVDIPFSNFTNEFNIPFTINIQSITLNKETENE